MQTLNIFKSATGKIMGGALLVTGAVILSMRLLSSLKKYDLRGKTILITGGSRGLGLILARRLAMKGARLAICARSASEIEEAAEDLRNRGADVITFTTDVTDEGQVREMIKKMVEKYIKLDVIINNAGIIQVGEQDSMKLDDYNSAMNVHFKGPLYTMMAAFPYFKKQKEGRIVNIASIGGKVATPHLLPYSASKFALVGLSEGMTVELLKYNIRVTTVVPFLMQTGSPRQIAIKGNHKKEYAWFKTAASLPVLAQDPERSAARIIEAIEYGKSEVILSFPGKLAVFMEGIAPGTMNRIMSLVNRILPEGNGHQKMKEKKGYESESSFTRNPVARRSDQAAKKYNE